MPSETLRPEQHKTLQEKLLNVLIEMGKRFTFRTTEKEVMAFLCEKVHEFITPPFHLYIILQNRWTKRLEVALHYDNDHENVELDQEALLHRLWHGNVQKIIEDRTPLLLSDRGPISLQTVSSDDKVAYWLGVPMSITDRAIGALVLSHSRKEPIYSVELANALDTITDLAAAEIDHARLLQRLDILADIKKQLSILIDPTEERVFNTVMERAKEIVDTYNLAIILYNAETDDLELAFAYRKDQKLDVQNAQQTDEMMSMMPEAVVREIIQTNDPILLHTKNDVAKALEPHVPEKIPTTWLGVPMRLGSKTIGIFAIFHTRLENVYTEDDIQILDDLSDQAAIAIGNARLFLKEQTQRVQAESLANISRIINVSLDQKTVCENILNELRKLVPYESASIQRIYGNQRTMIAYHGERIESYDPQLLRNVSEDRLIERIVQTQQSVVISDTTAPNALWEQRDSTIRVKSWIGVPLISEEEVIGILTIDHPQSGFYAIEDGDRAMLFANHAATALLNAELFQQQKNYQRILQDVYPAIPDIGQEETPTVLQRILDNGVALTGADYAELWFFDADTQMIHLEIDYQNKRKSAFIEQGYMRFNIHETPSIVGHVIQNNASYLCHEARDVEFYLAVFPDIQSELAVPLRHQEHMLGVFNFESVKPHAFTPEHQHLLEALAGPVAIAIHNANLYRQLDDRNKRQNILIDIGRHFTSSIQRHEDEILHVIYDQASRLSGMDQNFSIVLYDERTETIEFKLVYQNGRKIDLQQEHGWEARTIQRTVKPGQRRGKTDEILCSNSYLLLTCQEEIEAWGQYDVQDFKGYEEGKVANAWLGVPMRASGTTIGVLATYHFGQEDVYTGADVEILQALADHAAIALEKARIAEQTQNLNRRFKALVDVGQALTSQIRLSEDKVVQLVRELIAHKLDMKNFSIALYDKGADTARFVLALRHGEIVDTEHEPGWELRNVTEGHGKTETIIRTRKSLPLNGRKEVERTQRDRIAQDKGWEVPNAWLGVPMMAGDNVLGVLADQRYEDGAEYTPEEVEIFQALANLAAIAFENSRLYGRANRIIQDLPDATFVIDLNGTVLAWNKAMEEMTGIRADDIIGHGNYEYAAPFYGERRPILIDLILTPDEEIERTYTSVTRQGSTLESENYIPNFGDHGAYLFATASRLYDAQGNTIGAIESIRDITELKKIQELTRQQKALLELAQTLTTQIQADKDTILQSVHQEASQLMDTNNMYIAFYDAQTEMINFPLMFEDGKPKPVEPRHMNRESRGRTEEILLTGEPILIRTLAESKDWYQQPGRTEFVGNPYASWIGVPMKIEGKILGVIATFHPTKEYEYDENDQEILEIMANVAAIALTTQERQKRLSVLLELAQTLTTQIQADRDVILKSVRQEASQLMDTNNMYIAFYDAQTDAISFPLMYENGRAKSVVPRPMNRDKRGRTEEILLTGESIFIQTLAESEAWYQQPGRQEHIGNPYASWIGVPMKIEGKILGVIATFHPTEEYVYSQDDLQILQTMANVAAIALTNQERQKRLSVLISLAQTLSSQVKSDESIILKSIHQNATELMDTTNMYVALYDDQTETIRFPLMYENNKPKSISPRPMNRESRGRTEEILLTNKPIISSTQQESTAWYQEPGHKEFIGQTYASWIGVPMRWENKTLGAVATYHPTQEYVYNHDDLQMLQIIANLAAITLQNSHLVEKIADWERENAIGEVAMDFAHKVNNTIGPIPPWINLLKEELSPESARNPEVTGYLDDIYQEISRILKEAYELRASLEFEEVDIREVVGSIVGQLELMVQPEILLNIELAEEALQPRVKGVKQQISTAIHSVVQNAVNSISGTGTVAIGIAEGKRVGDDRIFVKITVSDTGCGIRKDLWDAIFGLENSYWEGEQRGTGYGLWRARNIIETFGGQIRLTKSEIGKGSTFTIELPTI